MSKRRDRELSYKLSIIDILEVQYLDHTDVRERPTNGSPL